MSTTPQGGTRQIKISWILIIVTCVAIVVVDLSVLFALISESRLFETFGFGHVPRAKMQLFLDIGASTPSILIGLSILRIFCFGYVVFWGVKGLDLLGITHRFSRFFSGIGIIIPLVGYYVPWASLGEARQTLAQILERQTIPTKAIRKFDVATFMLGLVWIGGGFVDKIVGVVVADNPSINAGNWRSYLSNASLGTGVSIAIDTVILLVVVRYGIGFIRLYRGALAVAATGVFAGPEDDRQAGNDPPAYVPEGAPARS